MGPTGGLSPRPDTGALLTTIIIIKADYFQMFRLWTDASILESDRSYQQKSSGLARLELGIPIVAASWVS